MPYPDPRTPGPAGAIVWLVEDDDLYRETVARVLAAAPGVAAHTSGFASCEEVLAAFDWPDTPDVVLMDIGLPGMSGIEGIRRIKAVSPETRIVMLTVHEDNDRIFEALCAGASGYLLKPSSAAQIVEAVQAARAGGATINPQIASKVLDMFTRLAVPPADYGLTEREREVLHHLVDGCTKRRLAERLFLSPHTVDMHIRNIYAKLHVHSRSGAIAKALKERLV